MVADRRRLVDAGLRLSALLDEPQLHEALVEEAGALVGAQRVLLVLQSSEGPRLAGAKLPRRERAEALLADVGPWLDHARVTRQTGLYHGPHGAEARMQRSCVVAPLLAREELLGYLYCDVEGRLGRFADGDRDDLAVLASQGALALANLRRAQGLEARLAERTTALNERVGELEVIGAIQRGVARQLDFGAIVELVGDKLREVFATGDATIMWWDHETNLVRALYRYEHGVSLPPMPSREPTPDWGGYRVLHEGLAGALNTRAEMLAMGVTARPGTDWCQSMVTVPIVGSDRVLGFVNLQNHEREYAYGEAEVRLLQTIAASMGLALENARLVEETKQALERQKATAAVLQVISHSVADTQPVFAQIAESCGRLFDAHLVNIVLVDDGRLTLAAIQGWARTPSGQGATIGGQVLTQAQMDAFIETARRRFPMPMAGSATEVVFRTKQVLNLPDVLNGSSDVPICVRETAELVATSSQQMWAPLMSGAVALGSIGVFSAPQGGYSEREQALLKTFADQAV
ncbi:MAG: GAF domain-containing protein, partial [Caldimonas sp.]